jgi:hypothetical protein
MNELKIPCTAQAYKVVMPCPECLTGFMRYTGMAYPTFPYRYQHKCDACGATTSDSTKQYPRYGTDYQPSARVCPRCRKGILSSPMIRDMLESGSDLVEVCFNCNELFPVGDRAEIATNIKEGKL